MCPSLTFWVQLLILAILRIWNQLKGLCLKITILNTERKYSYLLCQYHHFEVNAWSIMNGVHVKYKGDTFLSIHLGLIQFLFNTCKEFCHWKAFYNFLWAGENPLKTLKKIVHYFNVILLSDVIWAFGPKVTRRVTYFHIQSITYNFSSQDKKSSGSILCMGKLAAVVHIIGRY